MNCVSILLFLGLYFVACSFSYHSCVVLLVLLFVCFSDTNEDLLQTCYEYDDMYLHQTMIYTMVVLNLRET